MEYIKGMKKSGDSLTEITKLIQYRDINGQNRLFGGRLMEWIDEAAGVAAMRHCGGNAVTLMVDSLKFKKGAYINDIVVLIAKVTYVGRTSMEVRVDSYVEQLDGERRRVNRAYAVFVALDDQDQPIAVEPFVPETDAEKREYEAAQERRKIRLGR